MGRGAPGNKFAEGVTELRDFADSLIEFIDTSSVKTEELIDINDRVMEFFRLVNEANSVNLDVENTLHLYKVIDSFHKTMNKKYQKLRGKRLMADAGTAVKEKGGKETIVHIAELQRKAENTWKDLVRMEVSTKPPVSYIDKSDRFLWFVHAVDFGPKASEMKAKDMEKYVAETLNKFKGRQEAEVPFYWASMVCNIPVNELCEAVSDGTLESRLPTKNIKNSRAVFTGTYAAVGFIIKPDPEAEPSKYGEGRFTRQNISETLSRGANDKTSFNFPGSKNTEVVGIFYNPGRIKTEEYEHEARRRAEVLQTIAEKELGKRLPIKKIKSVEV